MTGRGEMSSGLAVLCFLLLHTGARGFEILPGDALNHQEITEQAILNTVERVCHDLAQAEGTVFSSPAKPFTAEGVAVACGTPNSIKTFLQAILIIQLTNIRVDLRHALNASFHFDDEMFAQGKKIITEGLIAVKASNKLGNYEAARRKLGRILHPLQDFYSHSNYVELGSTVPNSNLIKADASIGTIANKSRATCRNCDGDVCRNNILEDIIENKILTSGYFGIVPGLSEKPSGKCSHGGAVDQTSKIKPTGGINKDSFKASHGYLHTDAANLAIAATSELLQDIRGAAGDRPFLQMMGIFKGSSKALCFVIDTTKSMSDDIATVKEVTSSIIDSEVGTENQPASYIVVPFNDPVVGPLIQTSDPAVFKKIIDSLSASGGGDEAEPSLSALELALTGAPPHSEIFLFTDAPAKDTQLRTTVIAHIERTQTVVNFMITESPSLNRFRRQEFDRQQSSRLSASDAQLYRELAQTSGGQAIEVSKSELLTAANIIIESTSASLVTLLQAGRTPGKDDDFTFRVDETVANLTVYITGSSYTFTLTSPTGESQQSTDATGSLITTSQSVGNFRTLRLKKQVGQWQMRMMSTNPYTLNVIGQSPLDFLFDFVEESSQGPFTGFDALDTRPRAGLNGSLLVTVTGSDSATVTAVALVESSGSNEIQGVVTPQERGSFLVQVDAMPSGPFVVRVNGQDDSFPSISSAVVFQRQSPTNFRASNVTISADSNSILDPRSPFPVPFSVMTSGTGGNFTIRATNSRNYDSTSPASLFLEPGIRANGTVTLSAPRDTPSGTDITLTIEAEAPGATDTNYVVLHLSVINTETDFIAPLCKLISMQSNCSTQCSSDMWAISVRVTDGDAGKGVANVSLRQGNGTLSTSTEAGNATLASYTASCCAPEVLLQVVDVVGNVGTCYYTSTNTVPSASTRVTPSPFLCLSIVLLGLHILRELGVE